MHYARCKSPTPFRNFQKLSTTIPALTGKMQSILVTFEMQVQAIVKVLLNEKSGVYMKHDHQQQSIKTIDRYASASPNFSLASVRRSVFHSVRAVAKE